VSLSFYQQIILLTGWIGTSIAVVFIDVGLKKRFFVFVFIFPTFFIYKKIDKQFKLKLHATKRNQLL